MVNDLEEYFVHCWSYLSLEILINEADTPLYNGCKKFTKFFTLVRLRNLKALGESTNFNYISIKIYNRDSTGGQ